MSAFIDGQLLYFYVYTVCVCVCVSCVVGASVEAGECGAESGNLSEPRQLWQQAAGHH